MKSPEFSDETIFVILPTLEDLEIFWRENKERFEFAGEGNFGDGCLYPANFLCQYEWVFGTSKSAVVRRSMRWDELGINCEFYDWAKHNPQMHEFWFHDREVYRASKIDKGDWSADDEQRYKADCIRRSPTTYRGWWRIGNLPESRDPSEWFGQCSEIIELIDPSLPVAEVERILQEQTFDDWSRMADEEVTYHDRASVEQTIAYWRGEKDAGRESY